MAGVWPLRAGGQRGGHLATEAPAPHPSDQQHLSPRNLSHTALGARPSLAPVERAGKLRPRESPGPAGPAATYTLLARGGGGGRSLQAVGTPSCPQRSGGEFPQLLLPAPRPGHRGWGAGGRGGQRRGQGRARAGLPPRPAMLRVAAAPKALGPLTVWPGRSPQLPTPWSPGTQHCGPRCSACRPGVPSSEEAPHRLLPSRPALHPSACWRPGQGSQGPAGTPTGAGGCPLQGHPL